MAWNLTDGTKFLITIHDDCPEDLAYFVMNSVLIYVNGSAEPDCEDDCNDL